MHGRQRQVRTRLTAPTSDEHARAPALSYPSPCSTPRTEHGVLTRAACMAPAPPCTGTQTLSAASPGGRPFRRRSARTSAPCWAAGARPGTTTQPPSLRQPRPPASLLAPASRPLRTCTGWTILAAGGGDMPPGTGAAPSSVSQLLPWRRVGMYRGRRWDCERTAS